MKLNEKQHKRLRAYLDFLLVLFLVLNTMDYAFSNFFILKYGIEAEANPIARKIVTTLGTPLDALIKILSSFLTFPFLLLNERKLKSTTLLTFTMGWCVINGVYVAEVLFKQIWHFI